MQALKGKKNVAKVTQPAKPVVINLHVPSLSFNKIKALPGKGVNFFKSLSSRQLMLGAGISAVLLIAVLGYIFWGKGTNSDPTQVAGTSTGQKANFDPLVPNGTKDEIKPIACPDKPSAICYFDTYLEGKLQISQQKLPSGTKIEPSQLTEIAKQSFSKISATDYNPLKTKNGDAVVVSYQEIKAQSVIYLSKDRMLFIVSEKSYISEQWADYLNSLN